MTTVCVVSARRATSMLAQHCAEDFEVSIADATGAQMLAPLLDPSNSKTSADLAVFVALNFRDMEDLLASTALTANTTAVGYVFGAYPRAVARRRNPIAQWRSDLRRKAYTRLERLYLGISDGTTVIADRLGVPVSYLPMAANVLGVAAEPLSRSSERPIAVSAFGRQHVPTMQALADRFNRNGSRKLLYATNFMHTKGAADAARYRAMFWQILKLSRLSLAFDQVLAPNPGGGELSYVGPRWFESLAAGAVIAGWAPKSSDVGHLLDWTDSTIELPENPEGSVELVLELLDDMERLERASARNLSEMNRRHDWRHRLRDILKDLKLSETDRLSEQLGYLADRSVALRTG